MTMGRFRKKKTLPQMTGKQKMKHSDFKIHENNRNDEEHEQDKENTETEKEKNAKPENNKEKGIEKNEDIVMVKLRSEDEKKMK